MNEKSLKHILTLFRTPLSLLYTEGTLIGDYLKLTTYTLNFLRRKITKINFS
jgi:hypothetical protein